MPKKTHEGMGMRSTVYYKRGYDDDAVLGMKEETILEKKQIWLECQKPRVA